MSKKITSPFSKQDLMPQEETIEVTKKKGALTIGIPKETHYQENRVCLTPDAVASLSTQGMKFIIETGAGEGANFSDKDYATAGAKIAAGPKDVFACPIILKVEPPSLGEIDLIQPQSVLFSALQLKRQNKVFFEALAQKRITALAFDYIRDEHGIYSIVQSLSEIAGTAAILIAAEMLIKSPQGKGLLLGNISGVPPCEVVILGAGTVGEFAARSALGLGANVKIFDKSITKLRSIQRRLGRPVYTATIEPKILQKALMRCDVAIGAIRGKSRAPVCVNEEMVSNMKEGAVIVDVSIDRGGCFETAEITSHDNPTFTKHGVIHYCVPNIPSRYSRTASISVSNIFSPYLLNILEEGGFEKAARHDKSLQKGMYFYHGILTNKTVADWFGLPFRDINLLFL
ncbi:MAG: alanine dehydrogenase [Lutibacter sp.]|nr:alanine dehydrogenase [Lutibacter sp.]